MEKTNNSRLDFDDSDTGQLEEENAELRELLRQARIEIAKAYAEARRHGGASRAPEMLLIVVAVVILNWMALYIFAGEMGPGTWLRAVPTNYIFGGLAVAALGFWVYYEAKATVWLVVPKCLFVLVAAVISASIFTKEGGGRHALALGLMLGALFVAATPFWDWAAEAILTFVTHPFDTVKGIFKKKAYDG